MEARAIGKRGIFVDLHKNHHMGCQWLALTPIYCHIITEIWVTSVNEIFSNLPQVAQSLLWPLSCLHCLAGISSDCGSNTVAWVDTTIWICWSALALFSCGTLSGPWPNMSWPGHSFLWRPWPLRTTSNIFYSADSQIHFILNLLKNVAELEWTSFHGIMLHLLALSIYIFSFLCFFYIFSLLRHLHKTVRSFMAPVFLASENRMTWWEGSHSTNTYMHTYMQYTHACTGRFTNMHMLIDCPPTW
jgi:hypothetical protein